MALPAHDRAMLATLGAIYAGTLLLSFFGEYAQTVLTTWVGQRVMSDLRRQLFAHLQRLSIPYFDRQPVGRLVTRLTSDVETLNELFSSGVVTVIGDVATLVAISGMMLLDQLAARAGGVRGAAVHGGRGGVLPPIDAPGLSRYPHRRRTAQLVPAGAAFRRAGGPALQPASRRAPPRSPR